MIPPTVEREFQGEKGSLQLWVKVMMNDLERMNDHIPVPDVSAKHWERTKYLTRAFDGLIANEDRTQQNILYTEDWRTILIDHSRSFRSHGRDSPRGWLSERRPSASGPCSSGSSPGSFEKIKGLDHSSLMISVGPWLEKKEIESILIRKKLVLDEIAGSIKEFGEDEVLY